MKSIFLSILFLSVLTGFGQKANLESAQLLFSEGKFLETYTLMHADNFKYKENEKDAYKFLFAQVCSNLYIANPELNSKYRSEGIGHASEVSGSEAKGAAKEIIVYLTTTIYNDMVPFISNVSDSSIVFEEFNFETLWAFRLFTIPANWSVEMLDLMGSCLYNDAAYLSNQIPTLSEEDRSTATFRYRALLTCAKGYFEILCSKHNAGCSTLETIKSAVGG